MRGLARSLQYGDVPLAPLIFQDDVLHGVCGVEEARNANLKIDKVIKFMVKIP